MTRVATPGQWTLVALLRDSLPRRHERAARVLAERMTEHLDALIRRLAPVAPERAADGAGSATRARQARRVLECLQSCWNDGDENLVRGGLDRVLPVVPPAEVAHAHRLLDCARDLAAMNARPETLWFFAWYLEATRQAASESPQSG